MSANATRLVFVGGFTEVAERVWVARYPWADVNVSVVGGGDGLLVVDTYASTRAAQEVLADVRRLGAGPVTGLVNTHAHWDHVLGNHAFREQYGAVPIHAHENAAAATEEGVRELQAAVRDDPDDPHREELLATEVVPADRTFSSAVALDLGDRLVELVHPGRGHTDGDLVLLVPDVRVLLAGDLVEESGPPAFGTDSWPMDWPLSLDIVLGLMLPDWTVVPGHGSPVDRAFVEEQRNTIGLVAEAIRDLASRGATVEEALAEGDWPYPEQALRHAVRRGYAQLPRAQKRLPLV
jgi:glyoxylase-like metal-dependent hydrolase (beta-lactamase superfamily II)